MSRAKVLEWLRNTCKQDKYMNVMKDQTINGIFKIMQKKKLIDKKGYFSRKFIDIEGKMENIKFLDNIAGLK